MLMRVFGMLLGVAGCVWALQGLGVLPGSFMSGDRTWTAIGAVTAVAGVWLLRRSLDGRR